MAYVLGFFAADGSMVRNNRGAHFIEFQITDGQLLFDIRTAVGSDHTISKRSGHGSRKAVYRLQIGSKEWFTDLEKHGFVQAKSRVLAFPKIPQRYHGAFVRGYFDGDGGVYFKKYKVKDRKKPRWVFSSRFTSGSHNFICDLHALLKKHDVQGGFIISKQKNSGFDLTLSHRDSVALSRLMYNNAPRIYLKRKYETFRKALWTLYEEELRW